MRINQFIAAHTSHSRRAASRLIEQGLVLVNNQMAKHNQKISDGDLVTVNQEQITLQQKTVLYAFNKPEGMDCNLDKPNSINEVCQTIAKQENLARLFPIGRLDKVSCGLILLTNDGALCHRLIHSEFKVEKKYIVDVDKPLINEHIHKLNQPFNILNKKTLPAKTKQLNDKQFEIILTQGLNRQIRRMCKEVGLKVLKLERIQFSDYQLAELPKNAYHSLKT